MKKLKINGSKLKTAIQNMSLTIKSAAVDRGKIGEKTLHRLLKGEPINETIVLRLFQNLGISINDYIIEAKNSELSKKEPEKEITLNEISNSRIVLKKFELPDNYYLPLEINWVFDFTNPNDEVVETLKSLNSSLTKYCGIDKNDNKSHSFESSLLRLTSTNTIENYIQELEKNEVYTYSGIYTGWDAYDEEYDQEYQLVRVKYINSKFKLALYFTRNNTANKLIAALNVGPIPPQKIENGYNNIIVNGDIDYYDDNGNIRSMNAWELL